MTRQVSSRRIPKSWRKRRSFIVWTGASPGGPLAEEIGVAKRRCLAMGSSPIPFVSESLPCAYWNAHSEQGFLSLQSRAWESSA
eukprot:1167455-Amphidinium_carterae.1